MKPLLVAPWVPCQHCNAPINVRVEYIGAYFRSEPINCDKCEESVDWWETVVRAIRENFMLVQAFAPLGAHTLLIRKDLYPDKHLKITFADHGIPVDAKILSINYTPDDGGLIPLEFHGNVPQRQFIPPTIMLYPVKFGKEGPPGKTEVSIAVTWVSRSKSDAAWHSLVDAFQAYVANEFHEAVVPANTAVELALRRLLADVLSSMVSKERADRFLEDAATYSYQLNVVLPALVRLAGAPTMPDKIRGALNSLNKLRNEIAHDGELSQIIGKGRQAEVLCSAVFGLGYLDLVRPSLIEQATT